MKFSRLDIDWSQFKWRVIESGHLFEHEDTEVPQHQWDFDTQEEAHAFIENTRVYNPEFECWWELVRND